MPNPSSGRNVALPDDNRPGWRPQDEGGMRSRRHIDDDDRYEEDRYMRGGGTHWEDRSERRGNWDRDEDFRTAERFGQGQSGYTAGRYQGDRSMSFQSRNQGYPGSFEDQHRERPTDDRFAGRGGAGYYERERGGYGRGDTDRGGPNLGTGGAMHTGYGYPSNQPTGYQGWQGDRQGQPGAQPSGGHRGKGPLGYQRSDERVREMVCEALTDHDHVDATNVEITVKSGEVILSGTVDDRQQKRIAEDIVDQIPGVKDVQNQIRVAGDKRSSREQSRDRDRESQPQDSMPHDGKRHRA
ncbi:MAG: transport-associated protein [Myxococcales bacterium]|nr:transport-associated protein [Myxococcales bacterium]